MGVVHCIGSERVGLEVMVCSSNCLPTKGGVLCYDNKETDVVC